MIQRSSHSRVSPFSAIAWTNFPKIGKQRLLETWGSSRESFERRWSCLLLVLEMMIIMTMRRWKITWFERLDERVSWPSRRCNQTQLTRWLTKIDTSIFKIDFLGLCLARPTWRSRDGTIKSFCISIILLEILSLAVEFKVQLPDYPVRTLHAREPTAQARKSKSLDD